MYRLDYTARSRARGKGENLHKRMVFLRNEYRHRDYNLLSLYARFASLKLSDCGGGVSAVSEELRALQKNIESIDATACAISDTLLAARFLDGLGDDYC